MVRNVNDMFIELVESGLFSEDELTLITDINGYSVETLDSCIYSRYGYKDLDKLLNDILNNTIDEDAEWSML
jgi:Fe-S oxidoreductase